ncbi:MAG: hypothetical protein AB1806_14315 [Acidobacteriota bacterium]
MTRAIASIAALLVLALPASPGAGTTTGTVSVSVSVAAVAKLTLSGSTVSFPNADPDTVPSITASEGALTIATKARTATGGPVTLTVMAIGDLTSGANIIAASNVSWTATGAGFLPGTLSTAAAQVVGSWIGAGSRTGTQTYQLANSWAYATGTYSTTATYTLTAQ